MSETILAPESPANPAREGSDTASVAAPPAATPKPSEEPVDLGRPELFFNRELSWVNFDERVLEEALDEATPLLERIRFLSIFFSNLDEFYMIRVSGLRRQMEAGVIEAPPDGMTPAQQLQEIREAVTPLLCRAVDCWHNDLKPRLEKEQIQVLSFKALKRKQRKLLRRHFKSEIFPALTPLAFDPGHPFPHISNLSLNLAVVIRDEAGGEKFARLKVPQTFPRLIRVPDEEEAAKMERLGLGEDLSPNFIWLEELVAANLDLLFPDMETVAAFPFRVTRDADLEIEEDEASDLLEAMSEVVGQRQFGSVIRLEVDEAMPKLVSGILLQNLGLAPYQVFTHPGPLGLSDLEQLTSVNRSELKYSGFAPVMMSSVTRHEDIFTAIRKRDILLFHPFDSFAPVLSLLEEAAQDPDVLAIKQTLYRVGPNSPIVKALKKARENGKQVSVLVELKARFDEENNIVWAQELEQCGVHVVYGVLGLKTHAKTCLVVRREGEGIRRYVHLGTGNYNPVTARVYTDFGYMTCDRDLAEDISDLFNALTGYSNKREYRKILVAPGLMRSQMLERILREIECHRRHGGGHLAFKMNSLVDKACIKALYEASQAGVKVDLQVRGICCLRPGVPGVSENITVTSIVGRFLEHSRLFYFRNNGQEEILMGSADLMPRNLDGRVEVLFPVRDPSLLAALRDDVLFLQLGDNQKSRRLLSDGNYVRVVPAEGEAPLDSQEWLLAHGGGWRLED